MKRAQFINLFGLLFGQSNIVHSDCHNTVGVLCEGEEYCPLGHRQKPLVLSYGGNVADGTLVEIAPREIGRENEEWIEKNHLHLLISRACSACGIVYIKQDKP